MKCDPFLSLQLAGYGPFSFFSYIKKKKALLITDVSTVETGTRGRFPFSQQFGAVCVPTVELCCGGQRGRAPASPSFFLSFFLNFKKKSSMDFG